MDFSYILIAVLLTNLQYGLSDDAFVTQTVYGFLDFTTTIGNTVMVFSPQSAPPPQPLDLKGKSDAPIVNTIETKPISTADTAADNKIINPTKLTVPVKTSTKKKEEQAAEPLPSAVSSSSSSSSTSSTSSSSSPSSEKIVTALSSVVTVTQGSDDSSNNNNALIDRKDAALPLENNLYQPEYDLLSRQPTEYAEETYRVVNLNGGNTRYNSNNNNNNNNKHNNNRPNKHKKQGANQASTVHQTSVTATHISEKTSVHKFNKNHKVRPTSTQQRVLKTAAPIVSKSTSSSSSSGPSSHSSGGKSHRKSGLRNRAHKKNGAANAATHESTAVVIAESSHTETSTRSTSRKSSRTKKRKHKNSGNSSASGAQKSIFLTPTTSTPDSGRRSFRPKIQPSSVVEAVEATTSSLYAFKLNRTPGRWQYKTSPKPRVNIRNSINEGTATAGAAAAATSAAAAAAGSNAATSNDGTSAGGVAPTSPAATSIMDIIDDNPNQNAILQQGDLEGSGSQNGAILNKVDPTDQKRGKAFVETLNVEISTPADFKDTYYEIATIKSPFTFQAGPLKKTRFITVTSTFEKTLQPEPTATTTFEGQLTENILESTTKRDHLWLDGSITTLNTMYLTDETAETPSLETVTESFTIATSKLRTQLLPVVRFNENDTTFITLVQTYAITSLITATKTLSPLETNQFIPSKNFKDFGANLDEAGSEINLELEFGDEDNAEELANERSSAPPVAASTNISPSVLNAAPPQQLQPNNHNEEQLKQLALLNLYNPNAAARLPPTVITSTVPIIKLETLWESHVVPLVQGSSTSFRTLSKSIGVVSKTEYKIDTSTIAPPAIPSPVLPPVLPSVNPFLLPVQQPDIFQTITSPIIQQAIVTQTNSRILKLTFGARTAYTTIFSTETVPTMLTTFVTTSVALQPNTPYPGFYPQPYPPYAYVG